MLEFLRGRASDRKLRLFACAWARYMLRAMDGSSAFPDELYRRAVHTGEDYADGAIIVGRRAAALREVQSMLEALAAEGRLGEATVLLEAITAVDLFDALPHQRYSSYSQATQRHQCRVLRDIFGNPFRPLPPRPAAIAPLAEEIYASRWELLPLLGEWLHEHGFWQEGEHCLDPSAKHVKGCRVVDWVTGRE
jgi:hypothetical protein